MRIAPLADGLGIQLDLDVRGDAHVFDFPLPVRVVDARRRRRHEATVHELRRSRATHQTAPSPFADQLAHAGASEVPRHGVPARTRVLIDDHHLGAEDGALGLDLVLAVARGDQAEQAAAEILDDIGGEHAARVESLVYNGGLLAHLGKEIPVEVSKSPEGSIRHVNIGDAAAGGLLDFAAIVLDPGHVPQRRLAGYGDDGNFPGACPGGIRPHAQHHLFVGRTFEESVDVIRIAQLTTVDGEQIFPCGYVDARLGQRRA